MKVTVCQWDPRPPYLKGNLERLRAHIAEQQTDFLLLPEMGFSDWLAADRDPDAGRWAQAVADHDRQIADLAGLGADVTPHVLRHTWATWFYSQTRDFGGLLDLGGWRKADMAQRYRKIAPADLPARLMAHGWDYTQTGAGPAYAVGATSTHSAARAELGNVSVLRSAKVTSQKTR